MVDACTGLVMVGPAHNARHLNARVEQIESAAAGEYAAGVKSIVCEPAAVAFVPQAVMTEVEAVIGSEDHDGAAGQVELIQVGKDSAHIAIDAVHAGVILTGHASYAWDIQVGKVRLRQDDLPVT